MGTEKNNWICPKCGFEIKTNRLRHFNSCNGLGTRRHQNINPTKIGTKEYKEKMSQVSSKMLSNPKNREKISLSLKKYNNSLSQEQKELRGRKLSLALKGKNGGIRCGGGRGKHGWYKGYRCNSSWELAFVVYNLDHNIKFERNTKGFEYRYKNKNYKYYPDFLMEDGSFVEIKGYMDDKNEAKVNQFKNQLEIIDEIKIKAYINYVIEKYGKDFINLYGIVC